ncbi:MAG TPA: HDOD domain-containing protein [Tepidisphaeraceae bacterium]|jgi:putative nucleotidyltransferase with HDIG domain|nr:HDOD domain-containing protein [Tepidisphaeraceae bacterium]
MAAAVAETQSVYDVVKKVTALATLPEVTARIIHTVEDQRSTAAKLHQIVAHDPALVTRILKVVNSAFYGLPGQIGSVERAIVLLGLNAVKNIAVAASIGQLFRHGKLCEGIAARELWTHCIAVGVTARDLAKQMKSPLADEAFLAGMIHDVGVLVSLQVFPEQLAEVCEEAKKGETPFCELETKIIGYDHQQLGAALAEQWKFPRSCQLVAGYHHRPQALIEQHRMLVNLVHVADTLCCHSSHGFNLTAHTQTIEPADLVKYQIDPAFVESAVKRLDELMSAASNVM